MAQGLNVLQLLRSTCSRLSLMRSPNRFRMALRRFSQEPNVRDGGAAIAAAMRSISLPDGRVVDDKDPVVQRLFNGLTASQRASLAESITLVESTHPLRSARAQILLSLVLEHRKSRRHRQRFSAVDTLRIGLSGPPGSGKSTFIEAFGSLLTSQGLRVAVLAVDPSSSTSGGSLLGDKTRMPELSRDPRAYIRPSPNQGVMGGVHRCTHESIVVCEAAGYDVVIVETVGVGQSEIAVADMVDMFCLIIPPAGGDELQGIKKGIVEVADLVLVNKSDGDLAPAARRIQTEYSSALRLLRTRSRSWRAKVMRVSALTGEGLDDFWQTVRGFESGQSESGELIERRQRQHVRWMWSQIHAHVMDIFKSDSSVLRSLPELEKRVSQGLITPGFAADTLLKAFTSKMSRSS